MGPKRTEGVVISFHEKGLNKALFCYLAAAKLVANNGFVTDDESSTITRSRRRSTNETRKD